MRLRAAIKGARWHPTFSWHSDISEVWWLSPTSLTFLTFAAGAATKLKAPCGSTKLLQLPLNFLIVCGIVRRMCEPDFNFLTHPTQAAQGLITQWHQFRGALTNKGAFIGCKRTKISLNILQGTHSSVRSMLVDRLCPDSSPPFPQAAKSAEIFIKILTLRCRSFLQRTNDPRPGEVLQYFSCLTFAFTSSRTFLCSFVLVHSAVVRVARHNMYASPFLPLVTNSSQG